MNKAALIVQASSLGVQPNIHTYKVMLWNRFLWCMSGAWAAGDSDTPKELEWIHNSQQILLKDNLLRINSPYQRLTLFFSKASPPWLNPQPSSLEIRLTNQTLSGSSLHRTGFLEVDMRYIFAGEIAQHQLQTVFSEKSEVSTHHQAQEILKLFHFGVQRYIHHVTNGFQSQDHKHW